MRNAAKRSATGSNTRRAEPAVFSHDSSAFSINRGDGGAGCLAGGAPPFAPGLLAGSINPTAGAFTPFYLRMTRNDSEQEITSYPASAPPGPLGKIARVAECPEAAIDAAKGRSGVAGQASPRCPAQSSPIGSRR